MSRKNCSLSNKNAVNSSDGLVPVSAVVDEQPAPPETPATVEHDSLEAATVLEDVDTAILTSTEQLARTSSTCEEAAGDVGTFEKLLEMTSSLITSGDMSYSRIRSSGNISAAIIVVSVGRSVSPNKCPK